MNGQRPLRPLAADGDDAVDDDRGSRPSDGGVDGVEVVARRVDCGIATSRTSSVAAVGNAGYRKKRIVIELRDAVGAILILPAPGNAGRNHLRQLFFFNYKREKRNI